MNYEELTKAGMDLDELSKRLMGNTSLIKLFVSKFVGDKTYDDLLSAIDKNDMKKAEIASHTLKGMCGNMALRALFSLFNDQVNLIRSGEFEKAKDMMGEISLEYKNAVHLMKEWADRQS